MASPVLDAIRKQYPQYQAVSDEQLLAALKDPQNRTILQETIQRLNTQPLRTGYQTARNALVSPLMSVFERLGKADDPVAAEKYPDLNTQKSRSYAEQVVDLLPFAVGIPAASTVSLAKTGLQPLLARVGASAGIAAGEAAGQDKPVGTAALLGAGGATAAEGLSSLLTRILQGTPLARIQEAKRIGGRVEEMAPGFGRPQTQQQLYDLARGGQGKDIMDRMFVDSKTRVEALMEANKDRWPTARTYNPMTKEVVESPLPPPDITERMAYLSSQGRSAFPQTQVSGERAGQRVFNFGQERQALLDDVEQFGGVEARQVLEDALATRSAQHGTVRLLKKGLPGEARLDTGAMMEDLGKYPTNFQEKFGSRFPQAEDIVMRGRPVGSPVDTPDTSISLHPLGLYRKLFSYPYKGPDAPFVASEGQRAAADAFAMTPPGLATTAAGAYGVLSPAMRLYQWLFQHPLSTHGGSTSDYSRSQ